MDRERGNKEKMRKCREWISIHFLILSPFILHFLTLSPFPFHFLILSPFSRIPDARIQKVLQPCTLKLGWWHSRSCRGWTWTAQRSSRPTQPTEGCAAPSTPLPLRRSTGRTINGRMSVLNTNTLSFEFVRPSASSLTLSEIIHSSVHCFKILNDSWRLSTSQAIQVLRLCRSSSKAECSRLLWEVLCQHHPNHMPRNPKLAPWCKIIVFSPTAPPDNWGELGFEPRPEIGET